MKRCAYHCGARDCGAHFSSLNAFEAHRGGDHQDGTRRCIDPLDDDRFELVATGRCEMHGQPKVGARIWTLAADLQRARERSGREAERPLEADLDREAA